MDVVNGGRVFESERRKRNLTIQQVVSQLGEGWYPTKVSKLETGAFIHLPYEPVIDLAAFYGMTPNEISNAYGVWVPRSELDDKRLLEINRIAKQLTGKDRDTFLNSALSLARAALKEK